MGVLTDDMTRLVGEIRVLRGTRERFLSWLKIEVAKSRQEVRAEMAAARRAWLGTLPAEPRVIQVQAPEGVAPVAEPVVVPEAELMEDQPSVEAVAEAEAEREEAEEAHEIPEEATEAGIEKAEAGVTAVPETRLPKKRKKKR